MHRLKSNKDYYEQISYNSKNRYKTKYSFEMNIQSNIKLIKDALK